MLSSSSSSDLPWIEKYRPKRIADVIGNQEIVKRLALMVARRDMPHLLLSGPPGIGKTTSILAMTHEILSSSNNNTNSATTTTPRDNLLEEAILELNASDERGIDTVRTKIKSFAAKKVTMPPGVHKVIILDEADSMTPGAQQALRRIMEQYSDTTRFALACNTSSKIIEAIQSRCAIFRFNRISDDDIKSRLSYIAQQEHLAIHPSALDAICFVSDGDMRAAVGALEASDAVCPKDRSIDAEVVYMICDQPAPSVLQEMILKGTIYGDISFALDRMNSLLRKGYAPIDIVTSLFKVLRGMDGNSHVPEQILLEMMRLTGETHAIISEGLATKLQMAALVARLCKLVSLS